jgi:hypothetical protein
VDAFWFVVLLLLSNALTFYLCLFAGKQARYVGMVIMHPVHLMHDDLLCPRCLGSHNVDGGTCLFCVRCNQLSAQANSYSPDEYRSHLGYVRLRYLWHEWDWREWCPQPVSRSASTRVR